MPREQMSHRVGCAAGWMVLGCPPMQGFDLLVFPNPDSWLRSLHRSLLTITVSKKHCTKISW